MFEEKDIKDILFDIYENNKDKDSVTDIICNKLIEECLSAGAWDNLSIFVVRLT